MCGCRNCPGGARIGRRESVLGVWSIKAAVSPDPKRQQLCCRQEHRARRSLPHGKAASRCGGVRRYHHTRRHAQRHGSGPGVAKGDPGTMVFSGGRLSQSRGWYHQHDPPSKNPREKSLFLNKIKGPLSSSSIEAEAADNRWKFHWKPQIPAASGKPSTANTPVADYLRTLRDNNADTTPTMTDEDIFCDFWRATRSSSATRISCPPPSPPLPVVGRTTR
ncbi:hypothetical protein F4778DRAFT_257746 [Xylariomycetidae sp. FL2044]|nr:hypothetical protein F4778DRAFT_257746 [Xylariomycetidae sp. FL2044]